MPSPGIAREMRMTDAAAARRFVEARLGNTPYFERVVELLTSALAGDPELRALIAGDGEAQGLALFGPVAGANGTWHIRALLVTPEWDRAAGRPFLEAVLGAAKKEGARLLVAELPADEAIGDAITLLRANGFRQSARIPDYFRDGVALLFLHRAP